MTNIICGSALQLLLLLLLVAQPSRGVRLFTTKTIKWYVPTRLTVLVPCLTKEVIPSGRTLESERGSIAMYRWIQENGNIIGSGYQQVVRLLKMPENYPHMLFLMKIICIVFDWDAVATSTYSHEINFYEGPTITGVTTVSFRFHQNLTDFVQYLQDRNQFAKTWCLQEEQCDQVLAAPVRDPGLEYPQLIELAQKYPRTPLVDYMNKLKHAYTAGSGASAPMFHLNFLLRLHQSRALADLCNPLETKCSNELVKKLNLVIADFGNAAFQALDSFAEETAAARKLKTMYQSLVQIPQDTLNFTLRYETINVCPIGFGPVDIKTQKYLSNYQHNVSTVACIACPPGTFGSNGLNCFAVKKNFYTADYGTPEPTPCPRKYVTRQTRSSARTQCFFNGTTVEILIMELMEAAWEEFARAYYELVVTLTSVILLAYLIITAYSLFWQLHRFITLMSLRRRRGLSDRLLKRFIAEAYLRDLRRLQYWRAAIDASIERQGGLQTANGLQMMDRLSQSLKF